MAFKEMEEVFYKFLLFQIYENKEKIYKFVNKDD